MDSNDMRVLFEEGHQAMRMNYYPPCPEPELAIGLNSHSDAIGLAILLQINEVEGLQIRKDGVWVPIKPLPNAFVINIGDIMEVIFNLHPPALYGEQMNRIWCFDFADCIQRDLPKR
ncbi:hypothetical protein F3Y22_tig00007179pilonHSYRG00037 [Hibiscus syriacus]|uniref:Fe2OG dioxygenase domain-containing protein n=1 Tax=Hibiscus syriacus TaxID=106335 RepID=A0A6A3CAK8_HIBSY|nr:hypothetical protein F3Y22_tig00007179pilonHSYRG00037 [Hibiscus syriacus]